MKEEGEEEGRKSGSYDAIESDMKIASVCVDNVGDRVKWRFKTWVADPK